MPEINIRNNSNVRRTTDDNLVALAKNIARAYREIGVLTKREYNAAMRANNLDAINDVIGDIPNMESELRLRFCKSFVANDTENFNNATPAILAYAYMATRGEDTPMARALATRIDDMSADFANSGGMVLENRTNWPLVDLSNIADVYEGFTNALNARIADLDASRDANKISEMKSNLVQMETVINDYDNTWGLNKVRPENASQYEHRWDELNNVLDGADLFNETKEQVREYNFTDENKETIPQFLENGELDPNGRAAALLNLTRGDIARRHVVDVDSDIDADKIEEELNDEFLIKLYETANADKIVQMSQENPEMFMDPQKRSEFIRGLATQGGEISDTAYNAALDENANATAGWGARFKKKLGTAAEKASGFFGRVFRRNKDADRLFGARMAPQPVDMRQKRIELFKRILKGFASGFVASAIITTIATAAAATAGISLAASMAAIGVVTAIGMGVIQVRRWQKNHPDGQLKDMLKDTRLLTSLGVSAVAVIAMCFGAADMAEAAMALGYGALALGGTKNAVEAYRDARNFRGADGKRISVAESIAWAIANAGAVIAGGLTGRMAANAAIDAYNNANPENRLFQNANERTIEHKTEHETIERHWDADAIRKHEEMMIKYHWETPESFATKIDGLMDAGLSHDEAVRYLLAWHDTTSHNLGQGYFNSIGMDADQVAALRNSISGNDINLTPESIQAFNHFNPHISETNTVGSIPNGPISTKLPANATVGPDGKYIPGKDFFSTYTEHGGAPYQDVPVKTVETTYENVTDYARANDGGANMAAFGNYNPRDNRRTALRDRIGTFWNRVKDNRRGAPKPVEPIEPLDKKHDNPFISTFVEKSDERPVIEPVFEDKPMDEVITDEVIVEDTPKKQAPEKIDVNFENVFTPPVDIDEVEHRPADKEKNPFDLPIATPVVNEETKDEVYTLDPENTPVIEPVLEDEQKPVAVADDKILALTRPQAKAWHDLNARLDKVRKKLDKSPHGAKAAKLRAEESKLKYYIANLCNKIGHNDYKAIERAAREALLREDLNQKAELINAGPGENATKWDVVDWRGEIAKLDKSIDKKIEEFGADTMENARAKESRLYFPAPVPGVQRQKKDARGDVKLPSENELYPHAEDIVIEEPVVMTEPENTQNKSTKAERRAARRAEKQERKDTRRAEYEKMAASMPQKVERFNLFGALKRAVDKAVQRHGSERTYFVPDTLENLVADANLINKPITTIRGVPVRLVDLGGNGNPITQNREHPMVVVEIIQTVVRDGLKDTDLIRVPFYLATGLENRASRPTGHWYPLPSVQSDGNIFVQETYNTPELLHIAAALDESIGDIRNWRDETLTQKRELAGRTGFVGGSDAMQHVSPDKVKDMVGETVYNNHALYNYSESHIAVARDWMERALAHIQSADWSERKLRLGAGIKKIGRRALNRFGFGYDDYDDENER